MFFALSNQKIGFERPNSSIAKFTMIKHKPGFKNPKRKTLLKHAVNRVGRDGLSSIKYKLVNLTNYKYYTHMFVDVGDPPEYIMKMLKPFLNDTSTSTTIQNEIKI